MSNLLLLVSALALATIQSASGIVILKSTDPTLLRRICNKQPDFSRVCHPYDTQSYVYCDSGNGYIIKCNSGYKFDYGQRACVAASTARVCPRWHCPLADPKVANLTYGKGPLSAPYGIFGQPGNITLNFTKPGPYSVFCPVYGHCAAGMLIDVTVLDAAPNTPSKTVNYPAEYAEFEEAMLNTDLYPHKLPAVTLHVGDKLFIDWDEPIHQVAVYDLTNPYKRLPIMPYPPQPIYKCPNWNITEMGTIPLVPGEIRLADFPPPPPTNYTWGPANKTESFFFVCPLGTHCRLGMVFKVTVVEAPENYTPRTHTVVWLLNYENFPDMTIHIGDSIYFYWGGFEPVHMLSILPTMETYQY